MRVPHARATLAALLLLVAAPAAFGQAPSVTAIKDAGGLFGEEAIRLAVEQLRKERRTPVVIETIKTTHDAEIGDLAERRHSQEFPQAVYILMAAREHKISEVFVPANLADRFPKVAREWVRGQFLEEFKRKNFDDGLAKGVKALGTILALAEQEGLTPAKPTPGGRGPLVDRNQARLTLAGARVALAAAEEKAGDLHIAENIAVVDDGGHLLAFARMDGARPASVATATTKAITAATFRQATGPVPAGAEKPDALLNLSMQLAAFQGDGKFTVLLGGVPIVVDGEVIGAVGVGGASGEQDAEVARAAVNALVAELKASPAPEKSAGPTPEVPKADPEGEKKARDPFKDLEEGSKPKTPE